jgi:hypothetical protein
MVPATIAGKWRGAIEQVDGLVVRLASPNAFPPGQPLTIAFQHEGSDVRLEARTIGSKRRDEETFELRVRLINLRKDAREALERACSVER